jgi:hypothetical protein
MRKLATTAVAVATAPVARRRRTAIFMGLLSGGVRGHGRRWLAQNDPGCTRAYYSVRLNTLKVRSA